MRKQEGNLGMLQQSRPPAHQGVSDEQQLRVMPEKSRQLVGTNSVATISVKVVFPAPIGPRNPNTFPS